MTEPKSEEQREKDKRELAFSHVTRMFADEAVNGTTSVVIICVIMGIPLLPGTPADVSLSVYFGLLALFLFGAMEGVWDGRAIFKNFTADEKMYFYDGLLWTREIKKSFWSTNIERINGNLNKSSPHLKKHYWSVALINLLVVVPFVIINLKKDIIGKEFESLSEFFIILAVLAGLTTIGLLPIYFMRMISLNIYWQKVVAPKFQEIYGIDVRRYVDPDERPDTSHLEYLLDEEKIDEPEMKSFRLFRK